MKGQSSFKSWKEEMLCLVGFLGWRRIGSCLIGQEGAAAVPRLELKEDGGHSAACGMPSGMEKDGKLNRNEGEVGGDVSIASGSPVCEPLPSCCNVTGCTRLKKSAA